MKVKITNKQIKTFWIFEGRKLLYSKYLGSFRTKKPQQAVLKALKISDYDYICGWRESGQKYTQYQVLKDGIEYNVILVFKKQPNFFKLKLNEYFQINCKELVFFFDKIYYKYIRLRWPSTVKSWLGIKFKLLALNEKGKLF